MRAALTCFLGSLLFGCGGAPPPAEPTPAEEPEEARVEPAEGHPPLEELEALVAGPAPRLPALPPEVVPQARWTVERSPAIGDPEEELDGFAEQLFSAIEQRTEARLHRSASLRCMAEEVARFAIEREERPSEALGAAITRACGSSLVGVRTRGTGGRIPSEQQTDDEAMRGGARGLLRQLPAEWADGTVVGLGFYRSGTAAALVMAFAPPAPARLEPWPLVDEGNVARLRLHTTRPIEEIEAWVNVGAYDAAQCTHAQSGPATLDVLCPMSPDDDAAVAQIEIRAHTSRGFELQLTPLLRRRADAGLAIDLSPSSALPESGSAVETVNALRTSLGREPLRESAPQSALNAGVAPHILASLREPARARRLTHGLTAGWRVEGSVQRGYVAVPLDYSRASVRDWLAYTMALPIARRAIVGTDVHEIAFGEAGVGDARMRLLTTYTIFEGRDLAADWFELIAISRRAAGLPAPQRVDLPPGLSERLDAVRAGTIEPRRALDEAMAAAPASIRDGLHGYVARGRRMRGDRLPREVMAPGPLHVSVAATHVETTCTPHCEEVLIVVLHDLVD